MKTLRFATLLVLSALGLLATGCHHTDDPAPPPTAQPKSIRGWVAVSDQAGAFISPEGTTVTVLGTQPVLSAKTDAKGYYELPHLSAGTYDLLFSRPGLSSFQLSGLPYPKADSILTLPSYSLVAEPTLQATSLALTPTGQPGGVKLTVTVTSPQPTTDFQVSLYISDLPTVSRYNSQVVTIFGTRLSTPRTSYTFSSTLDHGDLTWHNKDFAAGTAMYAVAHGTGNIGSVYADPTTGKNLNWQGDNLVASPVARFTMP